MSSRDRASRDWQSLARLAAWSGAVVLGVLFVAVVPPWVEVLVPTSVRRQITIAVLLASEMAYLVAWPAALLGTIVLGRAVALGRRRGRVRPIAGRVLLLSTSALFALALAEASAFTWLWWSRRIPVLPATFADVRLPDPAGPDPARRRDEIKVVVVGESSAQGLPYASRLSIGQIVAWKLQEALPRKKVSVEVQARAGFASDKMFRDFARLTTYRPDVVIVYGGHNEFSVRHPWLQGHAYYVDDAVPSLPERAQGFLACSSSVCALIAQSVEARRVGNVPQPWMKRRVVDVPVYTPEEYHRRRADFRSRLGAIAAFCRRVGAFAVFVIPPANDAGFEPCRSVLPPETPRPVRDAFTREYLTARALAAADPARAMDLLRDLITRQPGFAAAHYDLARLLVKAGEREEAYAHFIRARDCDGYPMRCLTDFQDAYREVEAEFGVALVDGQALFHELSPNGQLDDPLIVDPMHPTLLGHTALAQAVLARLRGCPELGWDDAAPIPEVDPLECASHFKMDTEAWIGACDLVSDCWGKCAYACFDPSNRLARSRRYVEASRQLANGKSADDVGVPGIGLAPLSTSRIQRTRLQPPILPKGTGGH